MEIFAIRALFDYLFAKKLSQRGFSEGVLHEVTLRVGPSEQSKPQRIICLWRKIVGFLLRCILVPSVRGFFVSKIYG